MRSASSAEDIHLARPDGTDHADHDVDVDDHHDHDHDHERAVAGGAW